jgi:hypothetical protein
MPAGATIELPDITRDSALPLLPSRIHKIHEIIPWAG